MQDRSALALPLLADRGMQLGAAAGTRLNDQRQIPGSIVEQPLEHAIAAHRKVGTQRDQLYLPARDLHLGASGKQGIVLDRLQRQQREADGPAAEAADAGLAGWNQQRKGERVAQVSVCDADQLPQALAETLLAFRAQ